MKHWSTKYKISRRTIGLLKQSNIFPPYFFHWAQAEPTRYRDRIHWLQWKTNRKLDMGVPVLDMTRTCRVKAAFLCVTELIAALIPTHGLLSFVADVYGFFNPSRKSIWLSVNRCRLRPILIIWSSWVAWSAFGWLLIIQRINSKIVWRSDGDTTLYCLAVQSLQRSSDYLKNANISLTKAVNTTQKFISKSEVKNDARDVCVCVHAWLIQFTFRTTHFIGLWHCYAALTEIRLVDLNMPYYLINNKRLK